MLTIIIIKSFFLGIGLAMDAFSISLANGLSNPNIKICEQFRLASVFGFFQFLMPIIGYIFLVFLSKYFAFITTLSGILAFILLTYIGLKLVFDGIKGNDSEEFTNASSVKILLLQAFATSIDALSVGFTLVKDKIMIALFMSLIIGIVTFFICMGGVSLGKMFGLRFKRPAVILGGVILIFIGIQIAFK